MVVEATTTTPTRQTRVFLQLFQALDSSYLVCPCFLLGLCLVVHSLDLLPHLLPDNKPHHLSHTSLRSFVFHTSFLQCNNFGFILHRLAYLFIPLEERRLGHWRFLSHG